VHTPASGSQD